MIDRYALIGTLERSATIAATGARKLGDTELPGVDFERGRLVGLAMAFRMIAAGLVDGEYDFARDVLDA
jgi:hypothetical protein